MSLKDTLHEKVKENMRAGKSEEVGVLRMLLSAIHNKEIDRKGSGGGDELTDEEIVSVLQGEAKKRRDSIEAYEKAGRSDLRDQEAKELLIITEYLPKQMNEEEIRTAVSEIIHKAKPSGFPEAMKRVMAELKGKADGASISKAVKEYMQ